MLDLIRDRLEEAELMVYSRHTRQIAGVELTSDLRRVSVFQPDIAVVAGAASDRVAMVRALPDTTRGVLVEKPLAVTVREGNELEQIFEARGTLCQVGYNLRFSQSLKEFRTAINSKELGEVVSVRAETGQYLPDWRPRRDYRTTVTAQSALGGGVLRELSHELDYLQWIFGQIDWVSAWIGRQSQLEIDVEDVASIRCGFSPADGSKTIVGQIALDIVRHDSTRTVTAICERGSLQWDGIGMQVRRWRGGQHSWDIIHSEECGNSETYKRQWDSFVYAVENSISPEVSVADGLSVLSVIEAVERSHDSEGRMTPVVRGGVHR